MNAGHTHDAVRNLVVDVAPWGDAHDLSRRFEAEAQKSEAVAIFSNSNFKLCRCDAEVGA